MRHAEQARVIYCKFGRRSDRVIISRVILDDPPVAGCDFGRLHRNLRGEGQSSGLSCTRMHERRTVVEDVPPVRIKPLGGRSGRTKRSSTGRKRQVLPALQRGLYRIPHSVGWVTTLADERAVGIDADQWQQDR